MKMTKYIKEPERKLWKRKGEKNEKISWWGKGKLVSRDDREECIYEHRERSILQGAR